MYYYIYVCTHAHIYILGDRAELFDFMLFHRPSCVRSSDSLSPEVHFGLIFLVSLWTNAEKGKLGDRKDN